MSEFSLCYVRGNRPVRFTQAETRFAPAVENSVYQVVGNRKFVVNDLMTLFAFPHSIKR